MSDNFTMLLRNETLWKQAGVPSHTFPRVATLEPNNAELPCTLHVQKDTVGIMEPLVLCDCVVVWSCCTLLFTVFLVT